MSEESTNPTPVSPMETARRDLMTLTKARLSTLVLVTTLFGYLAAVASFGGFSVWTLAHTLFGTILSAFGAAVFNQVMESDADAKMNRTADRPLPTGRIPAGGAFALGWILSAFGIIHLAMKVNALASLFAAATLLTYIFIYTPMKRRTSWNTIVGAVSGALPPLIGWAAGGGATWTWGAAFLFTLLFLWQLPHFLAINWMYRDEYRRGGFIMWANQDETGGTTSALALFFAILTALLPIMAVVTKVTAVWFLAPGLLLGGAMIYFALVFRQTRERPHARKLFFYTLLYLPLILGFALGAWK